MLGSSRRLPRLLLLLSVVSLSRCTGSHPAHHGSAAPSHKPTAPETTAPATVSSSSTALPSESTHAVVPVRLFPSGIGLVSTYDLSRHGDDVVERGRLFLTFDAGRRWREISPPGTKEIADGFFLDGRRGWVLSGACSEKLTLQRTTDGGRSWRAAPVPAFLGCHAGAGVELDFVDSNHGWISSWDPAANGPGTLLRTVDAGLSWGEIVSPQQGPVTFEDAARGWSTAISAEDLYRTVDGGRSWERRSVAIAAAGEDQLFARPAFFGSQRGVLPATVVHGDVVDAAFAVTSDGGRAWAQAGRVAVGATAGQTILPGAGQLAEATASPSVWWVVAYTSGGPRVWVTANSGAAFVTRNPSGIPPQTAVPNAAGGLPSTVLSPQLGDLRASDASTAWLELSSDGATQVLVTRDGGRGWSRLEPEPQAATDLAR